MVGFGTGASNLRTGCQEIMVLNKRRIRRLEGWQLWEKTLVHVLFGVSLWLRLAVRSVKSLGLVKIQPSPH